VDDKVYRVLEQRCGLFRHFVGPMQPVLAEARRMLLGGASPDASHLVRIAGTIEGDPLVDAAYEGKAGEAPELSAPPITRRDLIDALGLLSKDYGYTVRVDTGKGQVSIKAGRKKAARYALRREALEENAELLPLVLDDARLKEIPARLLQGGERIPLVFGTFERGAYRRSVAYWLGGARPIRVRSMTQLKKLLAAWDGAPAAPETLAKARRRARREAEKLVSNAEASEQARWRRGLEAQIEAARIRLLKELGRYLVAWKQAVEDLNSTFYEAMAREDRTSARLRTCFERLGSTYPEWPEEIVEELPVFLDHLTPNRRDARLLGSELDAALADPRWRASQVVERG